MSYPLSRVSPYPPCPWPLLLFLWCLVLTLLFALTASSIFSRAYQSLFCSNNFCHFTTSPFAFAWAVYRLLTFLPLPGQYLVQTVESWRRTDRPRERGNFGKTTALLLFLVYGRATESFLGHLCSNGKPTCRLNRLLVSMKKSSFQISSSQNWEDLDPERSLTAPFSKLFLPPALGKGASEPSPSG